MATFHTSLEICSFVFALLSVALAVEHCSSRQFPGYDGTVVQSDGSCPYTISADPWIPGQRAQMELANVEEKPFQLFLVSVQLGNSLIGHMEPEDNDNAVIETCRNTSVQHSDVTNKTSVMFWWTAPTDITATSVIVRASVGTESTFWTDCDVFMLDRSEEITTETIVTERIATPDVADTITTTAKAPKDHNLHHQTLSESMCTESGNMYVVEPGTGCTQFRHNTSHTKSALFTCPHSTRFDVKRCSCSFMGRENCKM